MEVGLVKRVDIDQEMQQAYLDYAMSVIVARALPDARDGLKPVQRRILYAMHDLNLSHDATFKKSARVVGEVLGKYHPHGDVAVYEAMARLAQDFSMRYPLVDGQGNFGSIDGDPPAAMRYTEVRLARFATEILAQLDRNTVDFSDNFDGTLREPEVLPAAVPNLLVNGATGIAVGMATSIPPHNLSEVVDALTFMIQHWDQLDEIGVPELMQYIKGPDFPTGGIILQEGTDTGLLSAYGSGKGRITVRGRVNAEDLGRGRSRLIITELPYQTNKTNLIERIAELAREGHLEGIADLRDESDRQGMRIVIELKQGAEVEETLRALYQRTPLQNTFGITLLALVDGEPRLLTLKQALRVFVEHRLTVVKRRSEHDLARAQHRAHILEGLRVALKNLDEVIALIRNAPDVEQARARLIKHFKLSEIQAQAILEMQLRRLASLERKKIEDEYKEVTTLIKELEALLKSPKKMRGVVEAELLAMNQAYGDRRRTQIFSLKEGDSAKSLLTATDLTPAASVWVGVTADGKIGRSHGDMLPASQPRYLLKASSRETLYLVSREGYAAAVAVHTLPEVENFEMGAPLYKACALNQEDRLALMFTTPQGEAQEEAFILTVTRQGMVKKSATAELPGPTAQRFVLVRVNAEDELLDGIITDGKREVGLISAQGMGIRFDEDEVRPMGLVAAGVMGIKLGEGDVVAGLMVWDVKAEIVMVASNGTGMRIAAAEFPLQGRYGQGVIAWRLATGVEIVGAAIGASRSATIAFFQKGGSRNLRFADFPVSKRGGKGGTVVSVRGGDEVVGLVLAESGAARRSSRAATSTPSSNGSEPVADRKAARGTRTTAKSGSAGGSGSRTTRASSKTKPESGQPAATPKPARKTRSAAKPPAKSDLAKTRATRQTSKTTTTEKPTTAKSATATGGSKKPASTPPSTTAKKTASTPPATSAKKPASRTRKPAAESKPAEQASLPGLEQVKPAARKKKTGG